MAIDLVAGEAPAAVRVTPAQTACGGVGGTRAGDYASQQRNCGYEKLDVLHSGASQVTTVRAQVTLRADVLWLRARPKTRSAPQRCGRVPTSDSQALPFGERAER